MLYNRHNTYFNLIIDSGDEYGVAQTCADNHFCAVKVKFAFVIFRKKSLIRSDYSADERQLNLSSVGVTADDYVYVGFLCVLGNVFGLVVQKNCEIVLCFFGKFFPQRS